jgi:hypothetical protein
VKKQLLLSKRIYLEGCEFAERGDSISSGLAISLFQDAVEMFVWTLIKERNIAVKENSQFTANIESLSKAEIKLSFIPQLLELNKSRVGFKHYGNLPDPDEAGKFRTYVEEFLNTSFLEYFSESFEELSLIDLVTFDDVRMRLQKAKQLIAADAYSGAISEIAIAKAMLFLRLDRFVPKVDGGLENFDSVLNRIPEIQGIQVFQYLTGYLGALREAALASLIRIPLQDYSFLQNALPSAHQSMNGEWRTTSFARQMIKYDKTHCKRAIDCLVALSIRMESIVR